MIRSSEFWVRQQAPMDADRCSWKTWELQPDDEMVTNSNGRRSKAKLWAWNEVRLFSQTGRSPTSLMLLVLDHVRAGQSTLAHFAKRRYNRPLQDVYRDLPRIRHLS